MLRRYIRFLPILVTISILVFLQSCSLLSDPNSLAGRIGNFSRGKLGPGGQGAPNITSLQDITSDYGGVTPINPNGDDSAVVEAQNNRERDVQVRITARVLKTLPDDRKGNPHQR
ncbi:MAG: DUF3465 domain-containing protein, partial [Cyanobacteria bacterium]|nr:DUF3465 domain-containing protein [Cyanobacteriota bacterium]